MTRVAESELLRRVKLLEGTTVYGSQRKRYGVVDKVNQDAVRLQSERNSTLLIRFVGLYDVYLFLLIKGLLTRQDLVKVPRQFGGGTHDIDRFTGRLGRRTRNLLVHSTAIFAILGAALTEQVEVFNKGQDPRAVTRSGIRLRSSEEG